LIPLNSPEKLTEAIRELGNDPPRAAERREMRADGTQNNILMAPVAIAN
jgi:hypothetical protein